MVLSFKKLSLLILVLLLAVGVVGCGKSEDKRNFSIATGGTAGTYYPLGVAIAEILNKALPNVQATAQSTGATIANINMLKEGSVDIAFVQNDIVYYAANGLEMFEGKKVNIDGVIYWQYFCSRCKTIHYEKSVNQKDIGDLYESNNTEKTNQGKERHSDCGCENSG